MSNFPSGVGRAVVSSYSGAAQVQNVIFATIRKWVGSGFKYGGYRRVCVGKIRTVQDSSGHARCLRITWRLRYPAAEVKTKERECTGKKLPQTCCVCSLTRTVIITGVKCWYQVHMTVYRSFSGMFLLRTVCVMVGKG